MSRAPRKRSKSGIYHVMLRGLDRRNIFLDKEDMERFLMILLKVKETGAFEFYGYCLMDNHVHLLVKEHEEIGKGIKRITVSYVQWHNNKYDRTGHLFQNRYKSEPVENEGSLFAVLRYIHQNPLKAKMVKNFEQYQWSSFHDYTLVYEGEKTNLDAELITSYFTTKESFISYMNEIVDQEFIDYEDKRKCTDVEIMKMINKITHLESIIKLPKKERDSIINKIYHDSGASIRQLSRVIGLGRSVVEKATKKVTDETSP
ncbi:MAG: transposase [Desulfitibacter sp. BRH_c19]|nr:MAG: transposase [Desulfitibacter sp. BRH_c19]